jgi:hypothetical protein
VVQVLQLWQQQDVPLATSRKEWLKSDGRSHTEITAFKEVADRVALAEYVLTGQLGEAAVGSTAMFVLPPKALRVPEENFLEVCGAVGSHRV